MSFRRNLCIDSGISRKSRIEYNETAYREKSEVEASPWWVKGRPDPYSFPDAASMFFWKEGWFGSRSRYNWDPKRDRQVAWAGMVVINERPPWGQGSPTGNEGSTGIEAGKRNRRGRKK